MDNGMVRIGLLVCAAWGALAAGVLGGEAEPAGGGEAGQASKRSVVGTGTVLQVNEDAITSPEILRGVRGELAEWAGRLEGKQFLAQAQKAIAQAVINEVQNRLLYQYAQELLAESGDFEEVLAQEMADRRRKLLGRYGGSEAEAHAQLAAVGSSVDRELESSERQLVISIYRDTFIRPAVEITRSQMIRYYERNREELYHVEPTIEFQLIDIPAEAFGAESADGEAALGAARRQALAALAEIEAGEDFSEVVGRYSHGFYKGQAGRWRPMNPASVSERYGVVVAALASLEVGGHSGIVAGEDRFFIAKLLGRQEERFVSFAEVQDQIADELFARRWQKDSTVLLEKLLVRATVGDTQKFVTHVTLLAYEEFLPVVQKQAAK